MKRNLIFLLTGWLAGVMAATAQPQSRTVYYDEEDGLPQGHVTQVLQDAQGFMWFATWNGLCRYDGYEFRTFKSQAGDGCQMTTDRFRDIALRPDGKIICRVDDDYYLFDTRTYRFSNMTAREAARAADDAKRYRMSQAWKVDGGKKGFTYTDHQGNRWVVPGNGILKEMPVEQHTERLPIEPQAEVKCLFTDSRQRCWLATKDDAAVRVLERWGEPGATMRYLGSDGRLHSQYARFGAAVYSMHQSADGTLWLGTKPDGMYRLRETSVGVFHVDHLTDLPNQNVYNMVDDGQGRLWVATLDGGLCYTDQPKADAPHFRVPKGYPKDGAQRVRFLRLARKGQVLMAATTDGLVVAELKPRADDMLFRWHRREADRPQSLSSSATMDIMQGLGDRLYVSTESGGVNRIDGDDLTAEQLVFTHFNAKNHQLPTDVVLAMVPMEHGTTLVVSSHLVTLVDSTGHFRQLDARYFNADYRFSDAHPQPLGGGRWLFGLTDGAFTTSVEQMYGRAYQPRVVLTGVSIEDGDDLWAITAADTLTLQPRERNFTLHFAAIDYQAADRISYAFRLRSDSQRDTMAWNYIGSDRSVTLLDLEPGTYQLEIRSTNADGEWMQNQRRLTIVVTPTFWESALGRLLIVTLIAAALYLIIYTLLYIRRIKRKQRETLEAYLALLERPAATTAGEGASGGASHGQEPDDAQPPLPSGEGGSGLDPMLQRVMAFIEENIGNSDMNIGDLASAAATSRSGLQRKMKQLMGITPLDFLREARIKHACLLLRNSGKTVAEVAYACGFTDPKYFSRCFKQSMGQSPTDYKNRS